MNNENNEITVIVINRPTREEAHEKLKKLGEYLSEMWISKPDSYVGGAT